MRARAWSLSSFRGLSGVCRELSGVVAIFERVRDHRHKLIHYYEVDKWELFDLERDPHELHNVYGERGYRDVENRLKRKLAALRKQYAVAEQDPVPHRHWEAPPEYRRTNTQRNPQ